MRRKKCKLKDRALLREAPNDDDICDKIFENMKLTFEEKRNQVAKDIEELNKNEQLIDSMINEQLINLTNSTSKENIYLQMMVEKITDAQELIKKRQLQNSNCEIDHDYVD